MLRNKPDPEKHIVKCPEAVSESIAEILEIAILRIRAAAFAGDAQRCATEADHVHNLPGIQRDFHASSLWCYLQIEVTAYRRSVSADRVLPYEAAWRSLAGFLAAHPERSDA